MRIETNTKLAERNRRIATYLFIATLAVLIGGFIFINYSLFTESTPTTGLVFLQALILPIAFVLTITSVRLTNNWARRPFPEDVFKENIKGLSKKSIIYNYHHGPARHVLIAPQGVFTITTRWHNGNFAVTGDKWKTYRSVISKVFSAMRMDGIGNPTQDAQHAAEHVQKMLTPIAPDIEVQPLIVFIDERAEIDIEDPTVPVLYAEDKQNPSLTGYLRDINRTLKEQGNKKVVLPLSDEQIEAFEAKTLRG